MTASSVSALDNEKRPYGLSYLGAGLQLRLPVNPPAAFITPQSPQGFRVFERKPGAVDDQGDLVPHHALYVLQVRAGSQVGNEGA